MANDNFDSSLFQLPSKAKTPSRNLPPISDFISSSRVYFKIEFFTELPYIFANKIGIGFNDAQNQNMIINLSHGNLNFIKI